MLDLPWDNLPLPGNGGWLEISVRPSSGGSYSALSPRQFIGHVPYARHAATADFAASVPNASIGNTQINANQVQQRVGNTCPAGRAIYQIATVGTALCRGYGMIGALSATGGPGLMATYDIADPGSWMVWLTVDSVGGQHIAANAVTAPKLKANAVTGPKIANNSVGTTHIDTTQIQRRITQACNAQGTALRTINEDGSGSCNLSNLDGINGNVVQSMSGSTPADYAFVGGGRDNTAQGETSLVGGGYRNTTVYGGNIYATNYVGGGYENRGNHIMGGHDNEGQFAPGGSGNCMLDDRSFVAGRRAKTRPRNAGSAIYCKGQVSGAGTNYDKGAFLWADSENADFLSDGDYQFAVRAAGGIHFGTNNTVSLTTGRFISTSTGAYLSTGGTWTNASSRAWKTPFQPIDTGAILDAVQALPITTWHYIASPGERRHLGPMAEDFAAAFDVGDSTSISTTDSSGVALAAIQGLAARSAEGFETLRAKLTAQNAALAGEIAELEAMLDGLEQGTRR